jgi:DNA-binding MarR family transcriptional regulator
MSTSVVLDWPWKGLVSAHLDRVRDHGLEGFMRPGVAVIESEQTLISCFVMAQKRSAGSQLERSAHLLLGYLRTQGPLSVGELSEALFLDASTVQRQTSAAMREGLIERVPDPEGGIARKFVATPHGIELLDQERERSIERLEEILEGWSDEDILAYAALHRRFNEAIKNHSAQNRSR